MKKRERPLVPPQAVGPGFPEQEVLRRTLAGDMDLEDEGRTVPLLAEELRIPQRRREAAPEHPQREKPRIVLGDAVDREEFLDTPALIADAVEKEAGPLDPPRAAGLVEQVPEPLLVAPPIGLLKGVEEIPGVVDVDAALTRATGG